MSELLDKTDHPDLVVAEPVTLSVVDKNGEPNKQQSDHSKSDKREGSSPSFSSNTDSSASSGHSSSSGNENESTSISDSNEGTAAATHLSKTTAFRPYSVSVDSHEDADQVSSGPPKDSSGKNRHRLITGVCISLSLAILSLGALDLRGLIEQDATIDSKFNITYAQKKNQLNLPPDTRFEESRPTSEGLRPIAKTSWNGNNIGFADENGHVVVPPTYADVGAFQEGLAAVKVHTGSNESGRREFADQIAPVSDLWGYIDKSGKVVIPPLFNEASAFDNGVAPVQLDFKGALINRKGRVLATSKSNETPKQFGDMYQIFGKKNLCGLVDKTGKWILPPNYDRIEKLEKREGIRLPNTKPTASANDDQYFEIWQNERCGVVDRNGKIVIAPNYDGISSFNKGHAAVLIDGKYGFVDSNNKIVIEPRYDYVTAYDDVIAVKQHWKWHLLDRTGKDLNVQIDGVISSRAKPWISDGYGAIIKDKLCGFVNSKGVITIKPQYDFAFGFSDGYALVWSDGVWRYIDTSGNIASNKTFSMASQFYKNKADVSVAGPLHKFVNARDIESTKYSLNNRRSNFIDGHDGDF